VKDFHINSPQGSADITSTTDGTFWSIYSWDEHQVWRGAGARETRNKGKGSGEPRKGSGEPRKGSGAPAPERNGGKEQKSKPKSGGATGGGTGSKKTTESKKKRPSGGAENGKASAP